MAEGGSRNQDEDKKKGSEERGGISRNERGKSKVIMMMITIQI